MAAFSIIQADPDKYKNEILTLWKNNLPDTPRGRLEWMKNKLEGQPIWYLAIYEETGKVAGSVSIIPRNIRVNGKTNSAGILGDFMVEKPF